MLRPLFNSAQIRAIEQAHASNGLMATAGLAVARLASDIKQAGAQPILVLAGPGNNGGDAFVAARHLKQAGHAVRLVFRETAAPMPPDAKQACADWLACGGNVANGIAPTPFSLVIDGLFGIGLSRPLQGYYADLVAQANRLAAPKLAIDLPSGLCGDTGRVLGCALRADHTLSLIGGKPGQYTLDGPDYCGKLILETLGLPQPEHTPGALLAGCPARPAARPRNSHKGLFGNVAVLGGAQGMVGAALLAARAALLAGSGRVSAWLLSANAPVVDPACPELMLRQAHIDLIHNFRGCLVAGPGLDRSDAAALLLHEALQTANTLVLDADALHLLSSLPSLAALLRQRGNAVLTPHPAEAAALLDSATSVVQQDRIAAALAIAARYQAVTVLKGCGSVIATPDGRWFINASGNPGLASAGMGDVLAGAMAALAAQGLAPEAAAQSAVYLHGAAADKLVANSIGPLGLTASEIAGEIRNLLNQESA